MTFPSDLFEAVIKASAHSIHPLDEEQLRELCKFSGYDEQATINSHQEIKELFKKKKSDDAEPLPVSFG
jgi:hypothetical protein